MKVFGKRLHHGGSGDGGRGQPVSVADDGEDLFGRQLSRPA